MNRKFIIYGLMILAVAGLIFLKQTDPYTNRWLPKCMFYEWTGLHCPGCGITRALDATLDGKFALALRYNPLAMIGLPLVLILIGLRRRKVRAGLPASPVFCWVVFFVIVGYMLARNLPNPENGWLAPPPRPQESIETQEAQLSADFIHSSVLYG